MQYTLRDVPPTVDKALRSKARSEDKSLNQVAIEVLSRGLGLGEKPLRYRNLKGIAGTWAEDPQFDAALAAQDTIDQELWR